VLGFVRARRIIAQQNAETPIARDELFVPGFRISEVGRVLTTTTAKDLMPAYIAGTAEQSGALFADNGTLRAAKRRRREP
jgi:hypothetical protein